MSPRLRLSALLVLLAACSDATTPIDEAGDSTAAPLDTATASLDTGAPSTGEEGALFDLALLGDPADADCALTDRSTTWRDGVQLETWRVSYDSYESIDGVLEPIRIQGYAARPLGEEGLPGVVVAHGLGGHAQESHTTGPAAQLGVFTLAYTGPGGGPGGGTDAEDSSEGLPSGHASGHRMFDTVPDPRGSWFWGHTAAALRALTCLEDHPEVDASRLGMTGYSAGAYATLVATGVDPRIQAAVPLSGTGAWDVATEADAAWQHTLLSQAGLDDTSDEWLTLLETLDATRHLPGATGAILLVNGTTDQFFPVTAHNATLDAIGGPWRTALAANLDHGCYSLTGVESASDIEARAEIRVSGGQAFWFGHHFGTDDRFSVLPDEPTVVVESVGAISQVTATVDEAGGGIEVEQVTFWLSDDESVLYVGADLDRTAPGTWQALLPGTPSAHAIWYVDVQYATTDPLWKTRFALSSRPHIPPGLVPRIREIDNCLPPAP